MSTLLTSKPKVKSRFDSRDDALEGYLAKRSERSADSNRPQNADDYNYDDIVSRHRRRNNTTGAAARDGLVLKKTTMRRQMKREGRLGKDGKVRRGRAAPTRVVSRGASDDFEVPWRESRRRRRSSRGGEGAEEFKDEARAQRAPRRRGSSAPPQESIPTDGLSSAQLANLGRQLIADQRAQRRRSASVPPVVTEPVPAPAPAPAPAEPRKADSPPPPPPTTTTSSRPRPRPAPRTARRRQPYTSAEAAKGDGAYSSVSDMASKKLSAAANYIGAVFGAPAPAPAPTRRKPAPRPPPAG